MVVSVNLLAGRNALKKRTSCCFLCFYHCYNKQDQRIHQNTGCLITYQHVWCLFARQRDDILMLWEIYTRSTFMVTRGKLTPELWLVESLVDQLWICPFVCLPLYSLPLSFVCALSQSNRTKGRSPGVNMLQPFRFTRPAFRIIRKPRNESKL